MSEKMTYKDSGVDIQAGDKFVKSIKEDVKSTYDNNVIGDLGGFGGLYQLKDYKNPILVSGTDGVGTKLKVAFMMDKHDSIGIDAVAMCVNDIVVTGAKPLFFLDYLATGKLDVKAQSNIVKGIAEGCRQAGCSLIGGETAEMPGFYNSGEYDIAGFSVGAVEKDEMITGKDISEDDVIIGLKSSGIHSNGYSLVRKLFFENLKWDVETEVNEINSKIGEEILKPTRIYVKSVLKVKEKIKIKGMAHITGGGFIENIPRILPENTKAVIDKNSYEIPPIFKLIQEKGNIDELEMYKTFNMGIGMTLIVSRNDAKLALEILNADSDEAMIIGKIQNGKTICELV